MKKILAIALFAVMFCCTALTAAAANGSFVASPSGQQAPVLVSGDHTDENCPAEIKIVSYADRDTLGEAGKAKIEAAYSSIASTADLGALSDSIVELADDLSIESDVFMISELFDVSYGNCDEHEPHDGKFVITIKPTVTENFAALLHYNGSAWEIVEDCELDNGELTFETETLSPFAIMVHDGTAEDNSNLPWIIVLDVLIAGAAVGTGVQAYRLIKKSKAAEPAEGQSDEGQDAQ